MAFIYATRFGDGNESAAGSGVFYTVPTGKVSVIRSVSFVLFPGTTFGGIYRTASVAYVAAVTASGGLVVYTADLRSVLNVGETLTWQFQGGGGTWSVSGYELDS